jgi:hypothetical protein
VQRLVDHASPAAVRHNQASPCKSVKIPPQVRQTRPASHDGKPGHVDELASIAVLEEQGPLAPQGSVVPAVRRRMPPGRPSPRLRPMRCEEPSFLDSNAPRWGGL